MSVIVVRDLGVLVGGAALIAGGAVVAAKGGATIINTAANEGTLLALAATPNSSTPGAAPEPASGPVDVVQRILNKSRPNAQNQELQMIYRQLWRDQDKRTGGTTGELLREVASGSEPIHLTKAKDRLNQLRSLLLDRSVTMSRLDRKTAEDVMQDLRIAIKAAAEVAK